MFPTLFLFVSGGWLDKKKKENLQFSVVEFANSQIRMSIQLWRFYQESETRGK